ncbi:hypothetical protein CFter6_2532 [Collimonas fungivorans]|uniref:Uncharacterized protein n=1 Tax=Collimonas fungivorans TaxID=158899 RepID=A0A127PC69_9BURK|nr:hypothetical protein CFter6_2532 [Collimonas fungivorans]
MWIAKASPPHSEIGSGVGMPLLNRRLTQVAIWHGRVGPNIIWPDSATR